MSNRSTKTRMEGRIMKYNSGYICGMLKGILEWKDEDKNSELYKEIQILIRMIEIDLGLDDY
jgi:hypothetical protein